MIHIAIMKKSWGLTDKILVGRKKIESRWYATKCRPWDAIGEGETIYFKDSGGPVRVQAEVSQVRQFTNLTPSRVREILDEYGRDLGLEQESIPEFAAGFSGKKYCLLIFLKNAVGIQPFDIDKTGFGAMSAWITVDCISRIRIRRSMIMKGENFSMETEGGTPMRILEGEKREEFRRGLTEFILGLETALADPDLPLDVRTELEEQLLALRESQEEIEAGRDIKIGG